MKNRTLKPRYLIIAGLLSLASYGFAQGPVTITMTDPGNNIVGSVYVDPYFGTIGNSTVPVAVICDDYADETYQWESWTATVTPLSDAGSSKVKWSSGGYTYTITAPTSYTYTGQPVVQTAYDEAAWLTEQLLSVYKTDPTSAGQISYALWAVFDPAALSGVPTAELSGTLNWLNQAQSQTFTSGEFSDISILTPVSGSATLYGTGMASPQEFLVRTFEAPALGLIAINLLGAGVLAWFFRRRPVTN